MVLSKRRGRRKLFLRGGAGGKTQPLKNVDGYTCEEICNVFYSSEVAGGVFQESYSYNWGGTSDVMNDDVYPPMRSQ